MIRISFAILTLVFVQLVNGQSDDCQQAIMNLEANRACSDAFDTGTDVDAICMGECRDLFDAIINECDEAVSQAGYLAYNSAKWLARFCKNLVCYSENARENGPFIPFFQHKFSLIFLTYSEKWSVYCKILESYCLLAQ